MTTLTKKEFTKELEFTYSSFNDLPIYDERYMPRWNVAVAAYYRLPGQPEIIKTQTRDLSLAGVSLYISTDVPVNQKISLKIYMSPEKNFEIQGVVMWKCINREDLCYAGIFFDHLPQETQELILDHAFAVAVP